MTATKLLSALCVLTLAVGFTATPVRAQEQGGQATFGNLIAALNNINVQIANLEALNDLIDIGEIDIEDVDVNVVRVGDVLSGNNIRALNNALNRNDVDINILRNVLTNFLNDNDIDIVITGDVIAVNVLSGGDLVVYVD